MANPLDLTLANWGGECSTGWYHITLSHGASRVFENQIEIQQQKKCT